MSILSTQQKQFQHYLLEPSPGHSIEQQIVSTRRAAAARRLGIYADAYRLRLEEALSTDYEALHGLLGDEQFNKLCLKYIDAHPSQHFSLRYFGQHMSDLLRLTEPYSSKRLLSELAAFEWALIDAFDAQDSSVVRVEDIACLAPDVWPALRFVAHDSLRRLELAWNVPPIWKALKDGAVPEISQKSEIPQAWLVWRQELNSYFRVLSPQETWALDALCAGHNFALLCAGLCEWVAEDQAAVTAAGFLHRWVSDGLIKEVILTASAD